MEKCGKKQIFKEKLRPIFFVNLVWTVVWTALAVTLIVLGIIDGDSDMLFVAIAVGVFAVIGLVFFVPECIHLKKIIFKDDMIITHAPSKKRYELLLRIWNRKDETFSLTGITINFEGRILNLSWKRGWQKIDLTQIANINEWVVSLTPSGDLSRHERDMSKNSVFRNRLVKYLILTDRRTGHHIIELTNFKDSHQQDIIKRIEERVVFSSHKREGVFARGNHSVRLVTAPTDKAKATLIIAKRLGFTIEQATEIVDNAPRLIVDRIAEQDARTLTRELRDLGATIEFR